MPARLLSSRRGVRNKAEAPPLTVEQVLAWADEHHRRSGRWPVVVAGVIPGSGGLTWSAVDQALRQGRYGLMKIGGVTGWLRAAALAHARGTTLSSHLWPELSARLLCCTPTAHWLSLARALARAAPSAPSATPA
jgi:hypothetical protein